MTLKKGLLALLTVVLLLCLAAFGMIRQDVADPVTTSSFPQPDWLFMVFFQVTRYCTGAAEMWGVFWVPAAVVLGMFLMPFIDRADHTGQRKRWLPWSFASVGLALFLALSIVTCHTGSTTPLDSCAACHKAGFGEAFATPPRKVAEFSARYDNKWLALHYRYPQYFWMIDADVPGW